MFEFKDKPSLLPPWESIESYIDDDVEDILEGQKSDLYRTDTYKYHDTFIRILTPALPYPRHRGLIAGVDQVRFLLSFYPVKSHFSILDTILLRPRQIETGSIELSALYMHSRKMLVLYLSHPHVYRVNDQQFYPSSSILSFSIPPYNQNQTLGNRDDKTDGVNIPPLWYYINMIHNTEEYQDGMEKFFIQKNGVHNTIEQKIADISHFYTRHGY